MLLTLVACGRENFELRDDAAISTEVDAPRAIDATTDADPRLPNLQAWFRMEDDPSDGAVDDASGAGRLARCVPSVNCPTWIGGKVGSAMQFDGTQALRIIYESWLDTPAGFTIAAWIYLDVQQDQVPFARPYGTGTLDAWSITAWSPANLAGTCLETVDGGGLSEWACGPHLPAQQWFHVAGRWTGTSKAIFVSGVKVGEVASAPTSSFDNHDAIIGGDENGGAPAYQFRGRIDEFQIYDRGLTDQEILQLAMP